MGHVNAIYTRNEGVVESPMMVLQGVTIVPISTGIITLKKEGAPNQAEEGHQSPPIRPYQPLVPYPQRLSWTKLSKLEPSSWIF